MEKNYVIKLRAFFTKRQNVFWDFMRFLILMCLLNLEYVVTIWFVNKSFPSPHFWPFVSCLAASVLLFIVGMLFKDKQGNPIFELPNKEIAKKLFENVAGGRLITFVLLLFFLIHLELVYTNITDVFYLSERTVCNCLGCVALNMMAIVVSLFLYPRHYVSGKPSNERQLMISGLSLTKSKDGDNLLNFRNIDLLLKPIVSGRFNALKKVIVLPSCTASSFKLDPSDYSKKQFEEYCSKHNVEFEQATYETICNKVNNTSFDLNKVLAEFIPYINAKNSIENIVFDVQEPVDYDSYPDCVNRVDDILKNERKKSGYNTDDTLLYINPGTGVIGSALSAFAIPGTRQIVYAPQIDPTKEVLVFDVAPEGLTGVYSEIANQ